MKVFLLWVYFIVAPLYALGSLIDYWKKIDGPLDFVGYFILSGIKGLFWPIVMWF